MTNKTDRAVQIHRTMTPHQMALRIVELEDIAEIVGQSASERSKRINELLSERNATGIAIDNAIRGILPAQHPMLSRLQMIANMAKRITELQDALELAEEAVRAKHSPDAAKMVPDGWQLVPVSATKDMWAAWDSAPCGHEDDMVNLECAYRAMLAAAPKP